MPAPFRLSVLDQSPISQGSSGAQALPNKLDLARLADRLGYHRYCVAEEAIVVSITYEHEARRRSYELLAKAFELDGSGAGIFPA